MNAIDGRRGDGKEDMAHGIWHTLVLEMTCWSETTWFLRLRSVANRGVAEASRERTAYRITGFNADIGV